MYDLVGSSCFLLCSFSCGCLRRFLLSRTPTFLRRSTRGFGMWTQAKGAAHSFVQNLTRRTTDLEDVLFRLGVSNDCQRGTIIRAMGNKDGALKGVLYLPEVTEDELREKLSIDRWNARRLLLKAQHYRNTTEEDASGNVAEKPFLVRKRKLLSSTSALMICKRPKRSSCIR